MVPLLRLSAAWLALGLVFSARGETSGAKDGWKVIDDNDPAVTYSANVGTTYDERCIDGDVHLANVVGDSCSVAFSGTGVKWIGSKNSDHGSADVYLDGKLDATVSTLSPTWLLQQELYSRTGLGDGPHMLKIVIKTAGYQDFDAFEVQGAPVAAPSVDSGYVPLPAPVPYLNVPHRYPLGSGVGLAVSEANGEWKMLYGPGYTVSNLLNSEVLSLEIDGVAMLPPALEMHRARRTGDYYATQTFGDVTVRIVDYTSQDAPWLSRLVLIDNTSPTIAHEVRVRATVSPVYGINVTTRFARDTRQNRAGIVINQGPMGREPNGQFNYVNKTVVISFTDPLATASRSAGIYTLESSAVRVAPKSSGSVALCHYFKQDGKPDLDYLAAIRGLDPVAELKKSVAQWRGWFDGVPAACRLDRIKDDRARDLVEGALTVMKTNQCSDGGIAAHSTYYLEGYIRDAALALRGLAATGHFAESKKWLAWVDRDLAIVGHLNDSWPCGSPLPPPGGSSDPYTLDVEEPAYILICAREYEKGTHDLAFLKTIDRTLRFCMDVQLKTAIANGERMDFNGDETEICWAVNADATGFHNDHTRWSLSSVALCAASLNFYIDYVKQCGGDPAKYACAKTDTTIDLNAELARLVAAMDRDFWRTDVPEIPGGFHDFYRGKDGSWPRKRIVNFTLMPVFDGTPYDPEEKKKDVEAIAYYFNPATGFLQLVPGADTGFDGHDLGYLLWGLVAIDDPRKEEVYKALVDGPTADCWGSFNEAYDATGHPNAHDLRSLETGVNVSAIAKYWGLGFTSK